MLTYRLLGRNGRLGNQLWEMASTMGIAAARGTTAVFPYWRYHHYFSVPASSFDDAATLEAEDLGSTYLQELDHFAAIEPAIRRQFSPSPTTASRLARRHRRLLELPHKTAVHVRRGDYVLVHDQLYVQLDRDYYREAMERTEGPYLIFSDDIAWCRAQFPDSCLFVEHNRDYEDLFLMAACDAVIAANSTFSWWGAWLGGRRAIFPRRWFLPAFTEHPVYGRVQERNFLPSWAEVVDN